MARPAATDPAGLILEPLEFWLVPAPGPLLPQLRAALVLQGQALAGSADAGTAEAGTAEALRWAITAVDPLRGLRIEAVLMLARVAGP